MKLKLGVLARDKITGFTGIVNAKSQWLTGCDQYSLKPKVDEDMKMKDSYWFDEGSLEVIGPGIHKEEVKSEKKGGPREAPKSSR